MIVATDRVPAAIIQHVAANVVLDALTDSVTVVSLDADALVATFAAGYALRVYVALRWIRRAVGYHAATIDHTESWITRALVPRVCRVVRASFVLQTISGAAAFVCIRNDRSSKRILTINRDSFQKCFYN